MNPTANRGGKENNPNSPVTEIEAKANITFDQFDHYSHVIFSDGKLVEVPLRRGRELGGFIDQITFTIHEDSMIACSGRQFVSDEEYIKEMSRQLESIFGFGVTYKHPYKGRLLYESCYQIGCDQPTYGKLHFGGQQNTMAIEMTATGCNAAKSGWELRLYEFLTEKAERPKITRLDIAHDFLSGEYTIEQALKDFDNGEYNNGNRQPKSECRGSEWRSDDGTGRTLYIGSRESSKYTRLYEKGKQLGDKESPWLRFEIEFKARDIIIPFEALKVPGKYLGGAYPICEQLFNVDADRIPAVIKTLELTEERAIFHAKNQVGRLINYLLEKGQTPAEIINQLKPDHDELPKRLKPEGYLCEFHNDTPIHLQDTVKIDEFGMVDHERFEQIRAIADAKPTYQQTIQDIDLTTDIEERK